MENDEDRNYFITESFPIEAVLVNPAEIPIVNRTFGVSLKYNKFSKPAGSVVTAKLCLPTTLVLHFCNAYVLNVILNQQHLPKSLQKLIPPQYETRSN